MPLKLLQTSPALALSLEEAKGYLNLPHSLDDQFITRLITTATQWVENMTGKTLLLKKWAYTHENNRIILPHPPIREILEVRIRKRLLESHEYTSTSSKGSQKIEIPFYWGKPKLTVIYTAGFAETPDEIPFALTQALLSTVAYLYENRREDKPSVFLRVQPWIHYYRSFELT